MPDRDTRDTALALMAQYGDDADGDIAALAIWDDVIAWLLSFDAASGASPDQIN